MVPRLGLRRLRRGLVAHRPPWPSSVVLTGVVARRGCCCGTTPPGSRSATRSRPSRAWFLLVLAVLAIPAALYSVGYLAHAVPAERTAFVAAGFNVLLGAVEAVFVADSVVAFLFAWELMTLATAALVATEHETASHRRAAYVYLAMSHVGTGCLVAGFLILASHAGSLSFSDILAGSMAPGGLRDLLFVLFFVGFGVKAGMIPLHVWLPEAHPAAPSSISALMSGVLITTGLYGLFRVLRLRPRRAGVGVGGRSRPDRLALGDPRSPLRADPERPEAAARLQHDRELRDRPAGAGRGDDGSLVRTRGAGGGGDRGQPLPRPQPRRLQGTPVPGGGRRRDGHRHPQHRADGRTG